MIAKVRRIFRDNMNWRRLRDYFDTTIMAQAFRGDKEALSSGLTREFNEAKRLGDFVTLITSVFACLFGVAFFGHLSQNATNIFDTAALQVASLISLAIFVVLQYKALRIIALWFLIEPTGTSTGLTQKTIRVFLIISSIFINLQVSWSIFLASRKLVFESPLLKSDATPMHRRTMVNGMETRTHTNGPIIRFIAANRCRTPNQAADSRPWNRR